MPLLIEENRDVYVVFTRWGRIGEIGANHRTPFGTLEEAKTEFCKIFKQKTPNEWGEKDNFSKSHRKYNLIELKKRTNYKEYLTDFNHKHPIVESELSKKCKEIMEQLTSLSIYQSFLNNQQISSDQVPLSKQSLTDLRKVILILFGNNKVNRLKICWMKLEKLFKSKIKRLPRDIML